MAFGLFKRKDKQVKKDSRYHTLKIRQVIPVATDAVNVVFEKPEGNFVYEPGQFITIIDDVKGKKLRRAYSLCTTPYLDEHPAVTVKRVAGGQMSNHVNDTFQAGMQVEVMQPMGLFTTQYQASNKRNIVLFGGGSGITPLYAILRTVLLKEPESTVTLVYGNRDQASIIFHKELEQLAQQNKNFHLVHLLDHDPEGMARYAGRPTPEVIAGLTKEMGFNRQTEIFICGPQPMMDIVSEGLKKAGVDSKQIRIESFEAGKTSPDEAFEADSETKSSNVSEIIIQLNGESYSLTIDKSKPVLEQALNANIDMPYSCQSGLCTACRGKCLEGEISIDEAEGLSQEELDAGYVLTCVGKPLTDFIRVEIG